MKLRWRTLQSKVNAEEVKLFAYTNQLSMMDAKERLEDKSATVLQYWDGHAEEWINVPFITEYR